MKSLNSSIGLIALVLILLQPSEVLAQRTKRMVVGEISKSELQRQLPKARIEQKARTEKTNIYEVEMTEAEATRIKRHKKVQATHRHVRMTKAQAQAIFDFGLAVAVYAQHHGLHHNGRGWVLGGRMRDGLSGKHPHPKGPNRVCWVCPPCPKPDKPLLKDCPSDKVLEDLWKEYKKYADLETGLYKALEVYNKYGMVMGVKDMLSNMASAVGLLAPGPGTVASRAAKFLLDMAADAVLDAAMDSIMEELGLDNLNSKAALEAAIKKAKEKLDDIWDKIQKEKEKLKKCKKKNAKLQQKYDEAMEKYWDCIFRKGRCRWEKC